MPSGAMLINAASPPIISIELATGRVRPLADKECSIHQGYGHISARLKFAIRKRGARVASTMNA